MKKNITINLFGQLYNIDEDAYELLNNYEESLRQHLRRQADGTEIFNDIETRIAELLSELKAQGTEAVSIEHIQDIIGRIGRPEEIGADESPLPEAAATDGQQSSGNAGEASSGEAKGTANQKKRLYRDVENKMLAGVLAGLSKYLGGDVTWWRLGFVLACICLGGLSHNLIFPFRYTSDGFSFTVELAFVLAYIVLAIILPAADTPADRLKMKGEQVNPQTLADEVADESRRKEEQRRTADDGSNKGCLGKGCLAGFFTVLLGLLQVVLIAAGVLLLIPCGFVLFGLAMLYINPDFCLQSYMGMNLHEAGAVMQNLLPAWLFGLSLLVICFIPAYAAIHALMSKAGKVRGMSTVQRICWLIVWIAAALVLAFSAKQIVDAFQQASNERYQSHLYQQEGVDRSFYFDSNTDFSFYNDNHWRLLQAETSHAVYSLTGEYYTGDRSQRYFDAHEWGPGEGNGLVYRAERTDTVAPGRYRLSCVTRADNYGAYITVQTATMRDSVAIEPYGNEGGELWTEANAMLNKMPKDKRTSTEQGRRYSRIVNAHNGLGYGWSRHYLHHIEVGKDSLVTYGMYANAALSLSEANKLHWFSATDFKLEREE